ncbi:MAG TPA: S9 family peptidase [Acidimicrobiales bacterium]|nr:S9 family peptidase [Acidimicrobiales bacterium]
MVRTHGQAELVVVPTSGGMELVVSGDPDVAGGHPAGGGVHCWLPDGSGLVYVGRDGGLWRADLAAGPGGAVPETEEAVEVWNPAVSPDGTRVAWTEEGRRVVVGGMVLAGAEPIRVSRPETEFVLDPGWSPDGDRLVWTEWDPPDMPWDASRIAVARVGPDAAVGGDGPELVAAAAGVAVQQPRFSPSGRLGWISDATGWANVWVEGMRTAAPLVAGPEEHEQAEPAWGPGQRSWAWSPDGTSMAYCRNEQGFGRLVIRAVGGPEATTLGRGWHHGVDWKGSTVLAVRSGAKTPTQLVAYDAASGARTPLIRGPRLGVEGPWLVEPEPVEWRSADGLRIPARLYRPGAGGMGGERERASPVIMWLHGGPTGQMTVTFNARVAFFVSRGWAVLTPDFRGSSGWGRAHTQALRERWGSADPPGEVADCAAGLRWLSGQAWARADRVVVMGASAGGMTAVLLMAEHPELCAAGVDLYGVTDLESLAATTHRFEAHYTDHLIAPLPAGAAAHRARSPLSVADRIRRPLLILHGSDDRVVPVEQSMALRDATLANGNRTEMHVYDGEGHGWSRPETVEDELERTADFLARHVPGAVGGGGY